jgi:hypothetical protein
MNMPPQNRPRPPLPAQRSSDDSQIRAWLKLRRELTELHSQLVYLNLIMSLGVKQSRVQASAPAREIIHRPVNQRRGLGGSTNI